jgi:hypothetical protein
LTSAEHQAKAAENRIRRGARRQGYELRKARLRDPLAIGYNTWSILDGDGTIVASDLSLEQVAQWLGRTL